MIRPAISSDSPRASERGLRQDLSWDSPDDSRTGVNIIAFPSSLEDRREVRTATGTLGQPERVVERPIWPFSLALAREVRARRQVGQPCFHLPARPNEASRGTAERLCRGGSSVTRCYASLNRRSGQATYPAVCGRRATLLDNVHQPDRKPQCARNRTSRWNVRWPAIRAWGQYHSRILDRWAANTGRLEGATAEKAVPFPCAARRSFVLRFAAQPMAFSVVVPARAARLLKSRDQVAATLAMSPKQLARQSRMSICPAWHSPTGRTRRAILFTALAIAAPLAHAQQLPSIESLSQSYVACVQSAFVHRLDDFAVNGNLPQAAEGAFLDCQIEENALYTTAVASSAPGHAQAIALIRAAVEQLKANLKAAMLASPPTM